MQIKHLEKYNINVTEDGIVSMYRAGAFHEYKPQVCKLGYKRLILILPDGKRRSFSIHRLVAEAFIPNPEGKPEVNHVDGNKANNHVSNLEWVTRQENCDHAAANGLYKAGTGRPAKNPNSYYFRRKARVEKCSWHDDRPPGSCDCAQKEKLSSEVSEK